MNHPVGTTRHLHNAIDRLHAAQAGVHDEAMNRVDNHSISAPEELDEDEDE